jgi:DNA-binding LytR/AlgR family response regulator
MPVKIAICDDNTDDIKVLSKNLYAYDTSFQISTYTNGESLLWDWLENNIHFDIVFLDIYMPGLNGIETATKIRAEMKDTIIIFISSSNEHYPEAYDVFAFNYILKPLNLEKLNCVLAKALTVINREQEQQIHFGYKGITHRIFCRDIQYIESRNKIIVFHMVDKKILQYYAKMDDVLKMLPEESFIRCHQSYAVNIFHVTEMAGNYFRIDPVTISISKKYLKTVKDKYFAYLFANMNRGK